MRDPSQRRKSQDNNKATAVTLKRSSCGNFGVSLSAQEATHQSAEWARAFLENTRPNPKRTRMQNQPLNQAHKEIELKTMETEQT